jgi:hypothetical protein
MATHLKANYPNGNYFSVYEAGFCGTSYHQELCALGISNIIINPADLPMANKLKTNQTDFHGSILQLTDFHNFLIGRCKVSFNLIKWAPVTYGKNSLLQFYMKCCRNDITVGRPKEPIFLNHLFL